MIQCLEVIKERLAYLTTYNLKASEQQKIL